MAHSGFLSDPEYTRRSQDESVSGKWTFNNEITFKKVIRGTAIATYYADLAEYYEHSMTELLPAGTLVKFGGKKEITKTSGKDNDFFGVISSQPGLVLNHLVGENHLPVALCGRVPCRVTGNIKKFDKLTLSKIPGVAKKKSWLDVILFKPTIGVALEAKEEKTEKLIEIFVHAHL